MKLRCTEGEFEEISNCKPYIMREGLLKRRQRRLDHIVKHMKESVEKSFRCIRRHGYPRDRAFYYRDMRELVKRDIIKLDFNN